MHDSVLLVSEGLVHPSWPVRFVVRRMLKALPGYRFQEASSLEALPRLEMGDYQAIVLYVHHESVSPAALACLEGYVTDGGGLLALHSSSASFTQEDGFYQLLGGRFVEHGPIEAFHVQPCLPADDAFGGIAPFSVQDELYQHAYERDNRVHFYTLVDGAQEPVVWTRTPGRGRVCYCSLGHTLNSVRNPQVQQILKRGLAWACGSAPGREGTR